MAPAKKDSDEHVSKKQKQDSSNDLDVGKIAARHLLQGDQEDVIRTFNGFKNEEKFSAFDVLEAEGVMFNYQGVVKDLFQLAACFQEQPQKARRKWSSEEEGVLRQMIQESSDNIATMWFVDNEVIPKHGKDGTTSNILTNRTPHAIRMQLQKLTKTVNSTDESKLNAQLVDWPRPDDKEYEAFEQNTPQIVTDLRSGVARFTRGPLQMDALLTVCRVSQTNPVGGEESLRENLRICRAVFLKDFQVDEADVAWSEDAILAPKVPSATSWESMMQPGATAGPTQKIKEMFRKLADLHESIPEGSKKLGLTILVLGFDGLTTNPFNFPLLEEKFPRLSMTVVLMVGWRQLTNPTNPVLKDWEFSSRSRFTYSFYQLNKLANAARRALVSPRAAELLSVWAVVTAKKYDQAGTSFEKALGINTRGRNDMGKDWVEWNTKRYQCRMCLYTSRDVEDLKSHWASNHADYFCIFCGINQNRTPMRRFKTLQGSYNIA